MCASALPGENGTHEIGVDITKKSKNIPDVIDCNLKKDEQILIVLGTSISDKTGHQMIVQVPISPKVCFCTICKNKTSEICVEMNKKTSINFISPDLWPPTALTSVRLRCHAAASSSDAVQECQWTQSDWLKSGAEHYRHCFQWMEKASACLCSHKELIFRIFSVSS